VGRNLWDLIDLEFNFWFCAVGLGGLRGGFWVDFGGGLARGGLWGGSRWWFSFLVDFGGFGCRFFLLFCFTLLQNIV
jgi:hypothetical protein